MSAHFPRLKTLIQNASRKFLADIESWRKIHFHELSTLVDEADIQEPDEWIEQLEEWAKKASLWPSGKELKTRLSRSPNHWQIRAYLWLTRLKIELNRLVNERCHIIKQQMEIYTLLGLQYPLSLPQTLESLKQTNLELHTLDIKDHATHGKALELRERIDTLFGKTISEITQAEKSLDLLMGDSKKKDQTNKLLKLRRDMDDISSAMNLIKSYFDWASREPYIVEVIKYLGRAEARMAHILSQAPRS